MSMGGVSISHGVPQDGRVAGQCIGSLAEHMVFEELVISNRPCLLCWALCLGLEQPTC